MPDRPYDVLLDLACSGDHTAFDELVALYAGRIYRHCLHRVGNEDDAEDLTQKTFIKAYKSLAGFKKQSNFSTWLYIIAANVCRDHQKTTVKEAHNISLDALVHTEENSFHVDVAAPLPSVEDQVIGQNERYEITALLKKELGDKKFTALMSKNKGYDYEKIAEDLDVTIHGVKYLLQCARIEAKQILTQYRRKD